MILWGFMITGVLWVFLQKKGAVLVIFCLVEGRGERILI